MKVRRTVYVPMLFAAVAASTWSVSAAETAKSPGIFAKGNLVAWCIVPFDANKRSPEARAEMLEKLGIQHVAYDWREEHVATFEEEILAYKKRNLDYFAFWSWHPAMAPLIEKHGIRPQIWMTVPSPKAENEEAMVEAAAQSLLPIVEQSGKLGCRLGLYNHGGWGGEPKNMVAVCRRLREKAGAEHVGIVYNFHHGHAHIQDFAECLKAMKPYLFCVNLNGMNDGANPMIVRLGRGQHEKAMMETVLKSGYQGPIGILGHTSGEDVEVVLRENLEGMQTLLKELGQTEALKTYER
ncbi:MAG: sugar phosphate isomerase/epimerase family protein [Thermoguttaceae bacterium]